MHFLNRAVWSHRGFQLNARFCWATTALVVCLLGQANAQSYSYLHDFGSTITDASGTSATDGEYSNAGVTFDLNGNMFGTAQSGGAYNGGMVWEITAAGIYKDVHDFGGTISGAFGQNQADGTNPTAGVTFDSHGNMFGTTRFGGPLDTGIAWKISASGTYSDIHDFGDTIIDAQGVSTSDGLNPHGGISFDGVGNMYGATQNGGGYGWGILWEITEQGKYLDLHDFGGKVTDASGVTALDGEWCAASITIDGVGNLYGTASEGGPNHQGMAWEFTKSGAYKDLHDFGGNITNASGHISLDGQQPSASVALDSSGNVYGNAYSGGPNGGGMVWEITASRVYKDLHDFGGTTIDASGMATSDGSSPYAGLTVDSQGNLYGTTIDGGANSSGIVWVILASGKYVDLHDFGGTATNAAGVSAPDGAAPITPVTIDSHGNLYGTTYGGGVNSNGSIWTMTTFSLVVTPSTIAGGLSAIGTVTLGSDAGFAGTTINLSSSNPAISVHNTVTVPQGASSVSFSILTSPVTSTVAAKVSASLGATSVSQPLTVIPWLPIVSVSLSPSTVVGGKTATGTVTLSSAAPSAGDIVTLLSGDPSVTVPPSVTVASGKTTATFPITTIAVSNNESVPITGASGGVTASATLTVLASLPVAPWPKYGQNASNTGLGLSGGANGIPRWSYQSNGAIAASPSIGSDGTIYVGNENNVLSAVTPSGSLRWQYLAGGAISTAPLVASNGTIYFTAADNSLYSVTPGGTLNWKFLGSTDLFASAVMGLDGTIYFGGNNGNVYAVNPNGTKKWVFATGGLVSSSPAVGRDGTIYFGSQDETFYAVNPDGTKKWTVPTGDYISASPVIGPDGTIYIELDNSLIDAFTPSGTLKWSVQADFAGTIAIASNGNLYYGSDAGRLTAISPLGVIEWTLPIGSGGLSLSLGADGTIYTQYTNPTQNIGWFYAYNPDGTQKWKLQTAGIVNGPSAIGWDGTLYYGAIDGNLYAVGTAVNTVKTVSLTLNPTSVIGGNLSSGAVKLASPAPAGGDLVLLSSADPSVIVPPFVTVTGGSSTALFDISTQIVATNEKVAITATSGGTNVSAKLTVTQSPVQSSPWPKFGQNSANTGVGVGGGSNGLLKWKFSNNYSSSSAVIGADGTIYLAQDNLYVIAVNPDGSEKWQTLQFGEFTGAPAIGPDGTIYSATDAVNAISPSGSVEWTFPTGAQLSSSIAIGTDGTIYVGSSDKNLYALNPDGTLKWKFLTSGAIYSTPAIGADGSIYFGSDDSNLYGVNPDGSKKWTYMTGNKVESGPSIGSDGTIYVGSEDSYLYAINPGGAIKWRFKTGGAVVSTPAIGSDGTIYIGSYDANIYAINPNGTKKWGTATGGPITSSASIGLDGTIYLGSNDQSVYALNASGVVQWTFVTNSSVNATPAIGWDGTVYVSSVFYNLYALGTNVDTVPLSGVTLTPASLVGGNSATGAVTLDFPAPAGGAKVTLKSSGGAAQVPLYLTIPAGSSSISFPITTVGVSANTSMSITASSGGISSSTTLKITPAAIAGLSVSPSTVIDTNSATGTVTLTGAAPAGGLVVKLKSNSQLATLPATVTVLGGATTATFLISTAHVIANATVDLTATYGTVTKSATLKIKP